MEKLKLAFDASKYQDNPSSQTEDTSGFFLEAGNRPLNERINPRIFVIRYFGIYEANDEGEVAEREISEGFSQKEDVLSKAETVGAKAFYNDLLRSPNNTIVINISPPGGISEYKEGRINVAIKNENTIEFYGIPTHLTARELLSRTVYLMSEWTSLSVFPLDPDKLRSIAVSVEAPNEKNVWEFMSEIFPIDNDCWDQIINLRPWLFKEVTQEAAKVVTNETRPMFAQASSRNHFIEIGTYIEKRMTELTGIMLNSSSCPGIFNQDVVFGSINSANMVVDIFGNTRITKWGYEPGVCRHEDHVDTEEPGSKMVGPCKICKVCEKKYN